MNHTRYWADRFDNQQKKNPHDPVKALNFSNLKLMNQVHDEILSCVDFSKIFDQDRVLDTGCGTGDLLCKMISMGKAVGNYHYYATDISQQMLNKARENVNFTFGMNNRWCDFSLMSVDHMAFEAGYFSLILASESLQYTDPYAAILDLIRMTKDRGQVVISIPNQRSPFIQKAMEKHQGRFTGLDLEKALDLIGPKVSSFLAKPLIFAENQDEKPYLIKEFEHRIEKSDIEKANRFMIHLTV